MRHTDVNLRVETVEFDTICEGDTLAGFPENDQTEARRTNSRGKEHPAWRLSGGASCLGDSNQASVARGERRRRLLAQEGSGEFRSIRAMQGLCSQVAKGDTEPHRICFMFDLSYFFLSPFFPSFMAFFSFPLLFSLAPFSLTSFLRPSLCLVLYTFSLTGK